MSTTTEAPPDAVSAALALIEATTELLLGADVWQMPGQVQADALSAAERISRRLEYAKLRLLADFHRRDVAGAQAGLSTRQFLRARLHISSAEAIRRLHWGTGVGAGCPAVRGDCRAGAAGHRPGCRFRCDIE